MDCNCIVHNSVSKIENIDDSYRRICTNCDIMKRYKELVNEGKIDLISDIAKFHKLNKTMKGVKKYGSSNKRNSKRTLSKGSKKHGNKSK